MSLEEFLSNVPLLLGLSVVLIIIVLLIIISKFLKKVEPGKALIIISPFYGEKGPKVTFSGGIVFPVIHKTEIMDISTKVMTVARKGTDGLICKDNIRADIAVNFYLRVNKNVDDVKQVATSIGCKRASEPETLNDLFQAKFSEALKTVGKQMEYADLFQERTLFKEEIIKTIGRDLNGYKLEDTAIDYLAQTPLNQLDPNDIMDSEGIKKITELTSLQAIKTNDINQHKSETVTKRNVEAKERILELEKQQAEAEAKQQAEIDIIRSREEAEKNKIMEEERLKAEAARIRTDEQLSIAEANKQREVEIAEKNKERAVIVETERIEKERQLEVTEREKVVAIAQIQKQKNVEVERKEIQDIIKERVAVERQVAEEEERTKDTRADAGADRDKRVAIKAAEETAESNLITGIKAAEAKERAAAHMAKEKEIMAEAEKITALKLAEAKEILARGIIAEKSAPGLAEIKVKERNADAIVRQGEAESQAKKMLGEAEAAVKKDMASADALAKQQMGEAEAVAIEKMGTAKATAEQLQGEAEAAALQAKFDAEAMGLKEKAESMKLLDTVGREHEEFKIQMALQEKVEIEKIHAQKDISQAQAEVVAAALKSANIDIVGGETEFFNQITGAVIEGKSKNALVEKNSVLSEFKDALLRPGDDNVVKRIKKILDETGISAEAVKNLSVSALIQKIMSSTNDESILGQVGGIKELVDKYGIGDLVLNLKNFIK